jgi:hypothetical protein
MSVTMVFVQHCDGSAEPVFARNRSRPAVRDAIVAVQMSHLADAWYRHEGDGPWLRSTPEGDVPASDGETPQAVRVLARGVGPWRATHAVGIAGKTRYLWARPDGQDGPAPSLHEWLGGVTLDGDEVRWPPTDLATDFAVKGGVWHYQGVPYEGDVATVQAGPRELREPAEVPGGGPAASFVPEHLTPGLPADRSGPPIPGGGKETKHGGLAEVTADAPPSALVGPDGAPLVAEAPAVDAPAVDAKPVADKKARR